MAEPILTLSTLVDRRTVSITALVNGSPVTAEYELRTPGEFSLVEFHQIGRRQERVQAMFAANRELSDAEAESLDSELGWFTATVLCAPGAILDQLGFQHKLAVLQAFTLLQQATAQPAGEQNAPAPSTGESISPA